MKYLVLALAIMTSAMACRKDSDNRSGYPNATYKGTFKRYNLAGSQTANVTLVLEYPNYSGTSDIPKYPAIGQGTYYSDNEAKLRFTNKSLFTADFDWTLILDGDYIEVKREGDSLEFAKSYPNGWVDVYKLKKQ